MIKGNQTITLESAGANKMLRRGDIELRKGKKMLGARFKMTARIKNAGAGALFLTDAQKQALLAAIAVTMSWGKDGKHKPFNKHDLSRIHMFQRETYGSEMEGYTDTLTGLGRTLPGLNAETDVVCWPIIPTGRWWKSKKLERLFGVGRTQARTMQIEFKRGVEPLTPLVADLSVLSITLEFDPDQRSCKGDRVGFVPEYVEQDESEKVNKTMPDGLCLLYFERTAIHTASVLSDYNVSVDGEDVHFNTNATDALVEYHDVPNLPSEGDVSDRATLLLVHDPYTSPEDYPTGKVRFEQVSHDLATAKLGWYGITIPEEEQGLGDVELFAGLRDKAVKAVTVSEFDNITDLPPRIACVQGYVLTDEDDAEFQRFSGIGAAPGVKPDVFLAKSQVDAVASLKALHEAKGEPKAADSAIKRFAARLPFAVASGRGFARGAVSGVMGRVRETFK